MRLLTRDEIADGLFNADTVICLQKQLIELEKQLCQTQRLYRERDEFAQ